MSKLISPKGTTAVKTIKEVLGTSNQDKKTEKSPKEKLSKLVKEAKDKTVLY